MISEENSVKIAQHIAVLFGAYGQGSDIDRQSIYVADLEDFSAELVGMATKKLRLTSESSFVPTINDIIKACKSLVATNNDKELPTWGEAQREISKQIQDAGIYKKPVFSRPEIEQAVRSVGWLNICMATTTTMGYLWKNLQDRYEDACRRRQDTQVNRYILKDKPQGYLGYYECSNGGLLPMGEVMQICASKHEKK